MVSLDEGPFESRMGSMKLGIALLLLIGFAGVTGAAPDGLGRALDAQQPDLSAQQERMRRTLDAQRQQLQQQQEQTLRFQLLQPPRPVTCAKVGFTVFCQ